jgi:hypothetical protein
MSDMPDNQTPWMMFRNELASFLLGQQGGGDPAQFSGLQIDTGLLPALWDNPNFGTWLSFQTANEIPLWGSAYRPSNNRIEAAYEAFLTNIDAPAQDPAAADHAKELSAKLFQARKEYTDFFMTIGPNWATFNASQQGLPPDFQLSFEEWFAMDPGPHLSVLETQYDVVAADWVAASNKAGGGFQTLAQAVLDFNNPAFQIDATDTFGAKLKYRKWTLLPALDQFIADARAGQAPTLEMTIDTHTATADTTHSQWDFNAGFNFGFLSLGGGGGHERTTVDTSQADFSVRFTAAMTGITVLTDPWFDQNVVEQFKNGPFIQQGPFGPGRAEFFGPSGTFALLKSIIYVAWQPQISATLDQQTFHEVRTSWEAGGSLSIGPFSFGGGAGGSDDHAEFTDQSRHISLTSASQHPQIMATLNIVMPGN